jgi:hypothetical protein
VETYAAHGAEHVLFFLWRAVRGGAEFGWNGLVGVDGASSPRSRALPGITAVGEGARGRLAGRPTAYVHYSQDSLRLGALYDPDHVAATTLPGWHGLLSDLGYRIAFLNDEALRQIASLPAGPLVLPYSKSLSEDLGQAVAQNEQNGRPLIAGPGTSFLDQYARIYLRTPGGGLDEFLGVRYDGFDADRPLDMPPLPSPTHILQARLVLSGGKASARDANGRPMLVMCGNARTLGFDLGTLYQRAPLQERLRIQAWARDHIGL